MPNKIRCPTVIKDKKSQPTIIIECPKLVAYNEQGLLAVAEIEKRPLEQKPIEKPMLK